MDRKNVWKTYTPAQKAELDQVNERYKACLDAGKTERECVAITVEEAKKAGYVSLAEAKAPLQSGRQDLCGMHGQEYCAVSDRQTAAGKGHETSWEPTSIPRGST